MGVRVRVCVRAGACVRVCVDVWLARGVITIPVGGYACGIVLRGQNCSVCATQALFLSLNQNNYAPALKTIHRPYIYIKYKHELAICICVYDLRAHRTHRTPLGIDWRV